MRRSTGWTRRPFWSPIAGRWPRRWRGCCQTIWRGCPRTGGVSRARPCLTMGALCWQTRWKRGRPSSTATRRSTCRLPREIRWRPSRKSATPGGGGRGGAPARKTKKKWGRGGRAGGGEEGGRGGGGGAAVDPIPAGGRGGAARGAGPVTRRRSGTGRRHQRVQRGDSGARGDICRRKDGAADLARIFYGGAAGSGRWGRRQDGEPATGLLAGGAGDARGRASPGCGDGVHRLAQQPHRKRLRTGGDRGDPGGRLQPGGDR